MRTIFDLPAHPLFVHFPVVLVPLVATGAVALAARPAWRRRLGPALAAAALLSAVSAVLASQSGNALNAALEDRIGSLAADHKRLGETTVILTVLFVVATLAVVAADQWVARRPAEAGRVGSVEWLTRAAMALAAVLGVVATVWIVRTGHEGASIVWDGVLTD